MGEIARTVAAAIARRNAAESRTEELLAAQAILVRGWNAETAERKRLEVELQLERKRSIEGDLAAQQLVREGERMQEQLNECWKWIAELREQVKRKAA